MRLALTFSQGTTHDAGSLSEFRQGDGVVYGFAGHSLNLERQGFDADIFHMELVSDLVQEDDGHPFLSRLAQSVNYVTVGPWPRIENRDSVPCGSSGTRVSRV